MTRNSIAARILPAARIFFIVSVLIGSGFLLHSSFVTAQTGDLKTYKPVEDFSFLRRFICISDLFGKEQWHNNNGRSFDAEGVHLTNGKKHPVNACHYALFCFDEFKTTGDSTYFRAMVAQVRYLMDSTSYHTIEGDKIAYPYNITFHDLKPPWYSALAQSEAISVMIRYYALTKDTAAIPVIVKLKNFMLHPQENGCGTMSITPEGHTWYEEYPNSKQERQVLNGFLLAIVALYEYSNLFPDDTEAVQHYRAAIETVKASFRFYDTGSWLKYNRGDARLVANGYMKWQVLEMKLLYDITGDLYFKHLMMMVASYCYDKPYATPGCKLENYDFSIPLSVGKDGMLEFVGKRSQISVNASNAVMNTSFHTTAGEMSKLIDQNINSYAKLRYNDSLKKVVFHITFDMKSKAAVGGFSISYAGLDSLPKPTVSVFYKDTLTQKKLVKAVIATTENEGKTVQYRITPVQAQSISFVFENMKSYDSLMVTNMVLYSPPTKAPSDYVHYLTPVYKSGAGDVKLDFETKGMRHVAVFHKSAKDEKALAAEKWDPMNAYTQAPVVIREPKNNVHRFLIVCEPQKPAATVGKVKITQ